MSGDQESMRKRDGHDAAISSREQDHLDRWPFAREIYGVATTGPKDWSVRIGVYGEWGSGKTSVLNIASRMAKDDGHVVIWFNPWEFGSRETLWREFVLEVYRGLRKTLGTVRGENRARAKALASRGKKIITSIAKCANEHAGTATEEGLNLVKQFVSLGSADLKEVPAILGEKRVIVCIDDLDRTAPELVPEILFAIKELMDAPGFSFICAFDPEVVGKVLRRYHPGFGDGLRFLEKIIDYPRWLPIPTMGGLIRLAVAAAKSNCPFVPVESLPKAVGLLPQNPRSVRQFIRLISLMRPQIDRHNEDELIWPIILAAAVVKVRFPRLALGLLRGGRFWAQIGAEVDPEGSEAQASVRKIIDDHISEVVGVFGGSVDSQEKGCIRDALLSLAPHVELWSGVGFETLAYQMHVAEEPRAVTMKEFVGFWEGFRSNPSADFAGRWIDAHCAMLSRTKKDVYRDLLAAAVTFRKAVFGRIAGAHRAAELESLGQETTRVLNLLEILMLELGRLDQTEKLFDPSDFELVCEEILKHHVDFATHGAGTSSECEAELLRRLVRLWAPDPLPLLRVLNPTTSRLYFLLQSARAKMLCRELSAIAREKYAARMVEKLRDTGFVSSLFRRNEDSREAARVLLDVDGPLWKVLRNEALGVFAESAGNFGVQRNAYDLVYWFCSALRTKTDPDETENLARDRKSVV